MRYLSIVLLLFSLITALPGQNFNMHDIKFSQQIATEKKAGTLGEPAAAYYNTYIGKYREALNYYEVPLEWGMDQLTAQEKVAFKQYHPVNAYTFLAEHTRDEQIVIISEAHQKPQHRVFTRNMLEALYANGFRYLGIETLMPSPDNTAPFLMDMGLQQRGYPLYRPISGFYTREPQMSNMIREAIAIGFELFGYEQINGDEERDLQQALNIKRFMDLYPNEKLVIHCGWYHAIESDYPKRKNDHYMAYHLKQMTGINPLTIYQDALTERFLDAESPYYRLVQAEDVSVLVNEKGEVFNGKPGTDHFDIMIYHPPTRYRKNRPDWLYHLPGYTFVEPKKDLIVPDSYPVLLKAYPAGEDPNGTPVDIIELLNPEDPTWLVLKKGKYRIVIADKNGQETEYPLEFN